MKSSFQIQLSGFAPANRDATVHLKNTSTGTTVERKPFLDGSLLVRDLDPGLYEMEVRHPNIIHAVDFRKVRLFPQAQPTRITIPIPENLFRDTPIRDIPDANLAPVQQVFQSVTEQMPALGDKSAGEVIRASDWNQLVTAVSDMANAVLELTNLVAPKGHDHPEIAEKIDEVQGNLRRFADAFGQSLLELRREIETQKVKKQANDMLSLGNASQATRDRVNDMILDLEGSVQANPFIYTSKLTNLGSTILTTINELAEEQDDSDTFLNNDVVKHVGASASQYHQSGRQSNAESELNVYRRSASSSGGKTLPIILNPNL